MATLRAQHRQGRRLTDEIGRASSLSSASAFEDTEHERFGKAGFDGVVEAVAAIERQLGIEDLGRFVPKG